MSDLDLPTGTVTFLFTDLEGSTALLEAHPVAYREAVARHHALLQEAVAAHGGAVFETVGDAVYAAFARPTAAVAAALAGQRALHQEDWGPTPLRARMGLHHGEVEAQGAHYFGAALYRCARLTAAAHGGQVVLSEAAVALVRDALPEGAGLRDLGEHRLKDLQRPERVFQLAAPGLPGDFPALRTLDAHPHNLPLQLTSFVGRARELGEVAALLGAHRLVTLTGPGGTGKTRLALQAAADALEAFPDGVYFVALAPITDAALVPAAVASALGVREVPGRSVLDGVLDFLRTRHLLLVLDNFEQVLAAAPVLADLLAAGAGLKLLVTSREVLRLAGEHDLTVPPLPLPDPEHAPPPERLTECDAVRLFVERAQAARAEFAVTVDNALAVAAVCRRLDGLPLAIELAAARVRVLAPEQIAARLDDRFRLLTAGSRAAPERHQTLRAAIDWSYDLLPGPERILFGRLAVFAGGWTLEAAEAVGAGAEIEAGEVLDRLAALVERSLVEVAPAGAAARYRLLETIREYALERLEARGEAAALRRRHAGYYLALAEQAEPHLRGPQQVRWGERLEGELGNLRAALQWALGHDEIETALRLGGALWVFWLHRGHIAEGRGWLEAALARRGEAPVAAQAKALFAAGQLAWLQGELPAGQALLEEGAARFREVGDQWGLGLALALLGGVILAQGDLALARARMEEGVAHLREVGDAWGLGLALVNLAAAVSAQGDEAARPLCEESIALFRTVGDTWYLALALSWAGDLALVQQDYVAADAWFEEGLAAAREFGNSQFTGYNLAGAGAVALFRGDHARAASRFSEQVALARALGSRRGVVVGLTGLAGAAGAQGPPARAARLLGAADALQAAVGFALDPAERAVRARAEAAARSALDEAAFAGAYAEGRAMAWEHAVDDALAPAEGAPSGGPAAPAAARPGGAQRALLSAREREVAALVAGGLTNREIAARLVIAERTADTHVAHILNKLGFSARTQVAAWAAVQGLRPVPPDRD